MSTLNPSRRHLLVALLLSGAAATWWLTGVDASDDAIPAVPDDAATATFAGGCFWCMEHPFDELDGVLSTTSGYMGGELQQPTYTDVSSGGTGHVEVVQVKYNSDTIDYSTLLDVYWRNIDPLTPDAQFCDQGSQYRSAIFTHDATQQRLASASRELLAASGRFEQPVVTQVLDADTFWPAETYHQDYYRKNPVRYRLYRTACGRDGRLDELWGDPS